MICPTCCTRDGHAPGCEDAAPAAEAALAELRALRGEDGHRCCVEAELLEQVRQKDKQLRRLFALLEEDRVRFRRLEVELAELRKQGLRAPAPGALVVRDTAGPPAEKKRRRDRGGSNELPKQG